MKVLEFKKNGELYSNLKIESVIVDYDDSGEIISIEILGYSHISGKPPSQRDMEWLAIQVKSLGCDDELDVVTIQTAFESNAGQKSVLAKFGFDEHQNLVSLVLPCGNH